MDKDNVINLEDHRPEPATDDQTAIADIALQVMKQMRRPQSYYDAQHELSLWLAKVRPPQEQVEEFVSRLAMLLHEAEYGALKVGIEIGMQLPPDLK